MALDAELVADAALLSAAVEEAAALVMRYYGRDPQRWTKSGNSPVSEADLAADALLRDRLAGARPGYGWLSEETEDDPEGRDRARVWIVDPIDGTAAFLDGRPEFTICAALVAEGAPVAAAIDNPATGERFRAIKGAGATLNGAPLRIPAPPGADAARVLGRRNAFKPERWPGGAPGGARGYLNSIAYRACVVAAGAWDAAAALNALHEWDVAAADLIVSEAGGRITDRTGAPIRYNRAPPRVDGLLCAAPALHAELLARLTMRA